MASCTLGHQEVQWRIVNEQSKTGGMHLHHHLAC